MRFGKLLAAITASSLIATPVLANSAAPLSLAKLGNVKTSTAAGKTNKQAQGAAVSPLIIVGGVVGGITLGVVAFTAASNGSDSP
ncbi:hypothetical protein [Novosphingobium album (ex Hu et al. 2023)]|uniref:Uncharacterized protein n=1 Tax=Novosphingobium album (ex Hu et al. 2023) TaxID=2930093 RepID=A0ABT0B397_9SPHN|nr:hypothetical protein [Novosphingobium album (ex Hu et al. 2023)]MCJ2179386.1 hypothetical protein [Novosphingobium album (ex Hu et al. 2023)]